MKEHAYSHLKGVNLFHAPLSNCSQRVRLFLEEHQVEWQSHLVDLVNQEHLKAEFLSLQPNGVVPALVHNGLGIIESNDIIAHLQKEFPEGPVVGFKDDPKFRVLLNLSDLIQSNIKLLTYSLIFGSKLKKTPSQLEIYARHHPDKELVAWQEKFSRFGFSKNEVEIALQKLRLALERLDTILANADWLSGSEIGLLDLTWIVNAHRAHLIERRHPTGLLDGLGNLNRWYRSFEDRPSFHTAIKDYEPEWFKQ